MIIGVPKEVKDHESRVSLTPDSVSELVSANIKIMIETTAGAGSGYSDEQYQLAGATIAENAQEVYSKSDLIIKVKEPQPEEYSLIRPETTLFTYLHLAPDIQQTDALISSGATCIAYETVTADDGSLPLLTPMSEIAGRMATIAGVNYLQKVHGGSGVLVSGVPGVSPANVLIIGGGVVGRSAARMAIGLGASVTCMDRSLTVLRSIESEFGSQITTLFSTRATLCEAITRADLIIGAVLIPGAQAPKLIKKADLQTIQQGSVIVDVAVDQGGCFETTIATTHSNPTFIEQGIIHYCVSNMPGAYARTATKALNNATLPYIKEIVSKGVKSAIKSNKGLLNGLNIINGHVTNKQVADAQNRPYVDPLTLL